ncbi:MAG: GNAT family N-acetyltransferase [Oscillospiraceae bacterium]|nr:GNAT family N-acetyltransferase [Oscillospiraceae bacterium]
MNLYSIALVAVYLAGLAAGLCLAVVLHELGHLVSGRLTGYRFVSFRLLKWLWTKDARGRLRLTKSPVPGGVLGQCLMTPCEDEADFRFALYHLGGGLLNILTGAPMLVSAFFIRNDFARLFVLCLGLVSLYLGTANLIPRRKLLPNDGANLKEAKKSAEAARGLYLMLKTNAEKAAGKQIEDYPEDAFAFHENADFSNYCVVNIVFLRAGQLENSGRFGESYAALLRADVSGLPRYFGVLVLLELMFHELVHFGDEASVSLARERIDGKSKDKMLQKLLRMKHPGFMPYQAAKAAFLDGDEARARALSSRARELAPSLQNPGHEHSMTLMLDRLEKRLNGKNELMQKSIQNTEQNTEQKTELAIRRELPGDYEEILRLTYEAFLTLDYPGRSRVDEHFLYFLLRGSPYIIPELCLAAEREGEIVGHILYTRNQIDRPDGSKTEVITFGPLSVLPKYHRQGIGAALVRHSMSAAKEMGFGAVLIVGVPDYYPKLGFHRAREFGLTLPGGEDMDAFMAYELQPGFLAGGGVYRLLEPAFERAEADGEGYAAFHQKFMAAYFPGG